MRENIQPYVEVFSKSKNSLTVFFFLINFP